MKTSLQNKSSYCIKGAKKCKKAKKIQYPKEDIIVALAINRIEEPDAKNFVRSLNSIFDPFKDVETLNCLLH